MPGRHRKRRLALAHHDGAAHHGADARRDSADRSSSTASATSSSLLLATTASAPLDTSDRCDTPVAEQPLLVEHPLHGPPRQPEECRVGDGAIEPQVHGHDRRGRRGVGRVEHRRERRRLGPERGSEAVPRHGADHRARPDLVIAGAHRQRRRRPGADDRAHGRSATAPPRVSTKERAGGRVEVVERRHRQAERGGVAALEDPIEHERERCRRGDVDRLVERRHGERLPEQLDQPRRLAHAAQPLPHGFVGRAASGAERHPQSQRNRSRQPSAGHRSRPASRCSGDGSGGHSSRDRAPSRSTMSSDSLAASRTPRFGADAPEKLEGLAVAPTTTCWPLSTALAGGRIGERRGPAAERRPRLEHEHAGAALGQRGRGAEPGEAAADDDHIGLNAHGAGRLSRRRESALEAPRFEHRPRPDARAMSARRGRGTRMRLLKTS